MQARSTFFYGKVTKKREQYKINRIYFYCRDAVTSRCRRKVAKKRGKSQRKQKYFSITDEKSNSSFRNVSICQVFRIFAPSEQVLLPTVQGRVTAELG